MGRKPIEMPKLKKISVRTLEAIRKETSKYIYVKDKDGNAFCERCNKEFVLPKTKHLEECTCPSCKTKLTVVHKWRRHCEDRYDWKVVATVLNDTELVYRYIFVERGSEKVIRLAEVARKVVNFENNKSYEWEAPYWHGDSTKWVKTRANFFRECTNGQYRTNLCCLQADIYNRKLFINELKKMSAFKYIDFTDILAVTERWYVESVVNRVWYRNLAYEQLQKAGYGQLVIEDIDKRNYYTREFQYDPSKKSLARKLELTDDNFRRLKENQTLEFYKILHAIPNITDEDIELVEFFGYDNYVDINKACKVYQLSKFKTLNYIKKNVLSCGLRVWDYIDYLRTIDNLNYPIDNSYAYPKEFKKFKQEVNDRWNKELERRRNMTPKEIAIEEAMKDKKMYLISKALRESTELRQWFEGADGLKVFVPESVGELVDSGVNLHNCLSNYAEKIVSNTSIIFFIRRIDEPDKDYIAMEYRYGQVSQLRLDRNVEVTDAKIINFAEALARKLNEIKANEFLVASAIRKAA